MKNKLIIILIFLIGIILRLYPAIHQPLWLDEIYSLYFAHNFSPLHIVFQIPDCHPGIFYLILKGLLLITTNTFLLRFILAVIPQIIGCYLIQKHFKKTIITSAFLLNPFFIHYAWQIRMYGLVFLFSTMLIISILSEKINPIKITILMLVGNLISYALIIPTICLTLYLSVKKKKWLILIPIILIEFFVFKGYQYKLSAETASWISSPSFGNIPMVLLTMLGITTDINNVNSFSPILSFLFFIFFIPFTFFLTKSKKIFFYSFTFPIILTISISILFPFLSQHFFFHTFIPKISLFISRFLLPLSIYFYISLFISTKRKLQILLLIVLILLWINPYKKLNFYQFYSNTSPKNYPIDSLILPPWENLKLNQNFSKADLNQISKNYNSSLLVEQEIINFSANSNCQFLQKYSKIIYIDQYTKTLEKYQKHTKEIIEKCSKSL